VFDLDELTKVMAAAGFSVESAGTRFIKPFSHQQMQELIDIGAVSDQLLEGLDRMTEHMPGLGAELYMNCRLTELA
jgi:hypothetical protein